MIYTLDPRWSLERRRLMRKKMTPEESMLWDFLKARQLAGEKFRRQCGIGPYIVDFFCARTRLVVEVDGAVHLQAREYDAERDAYLIGVGCHVLRFTNEAVRNHIEAVLSRVRLSLASSS